MKLSFLIVGLISIIFHCSFAKAGESCFEIGDSSNPWHSIELPNGMSNVKWDGSKWVVSISFDIKNVDFVNWIDKCSIKLNSDPHLRKWFLSDNKDHRAIGVFQYVQTDRVCIEIEESQSPTYPENPKGFSGCIVE